MFYYNFPDVALMSTTLGVISFQQYLFFYCNPFTDFYLHMLSIQKLLQKTKQKNQH